MRLPEGADPDTAASGQLRRVEVERGRAGYGFTVSGERPCLLSGVLEGSPAHLAGLRRGQGIVAVDGADVSGATHEAVVRLIGGAEGPLRLVLAVLPDDPLLTGPKRLGAPCRSLAKKQRPLSEPDMRRRRLEISAGGGGGGHDGGGGQSAPGRKLPNGTLVVGYLSSTELILNTRLSEEHGLKSIRERIRQLGTEQDTHTLVVMTLTGDCVRLRDDAGAVLAAFPAENLLLGAPCAEDPRFFCLVTSAHVSRGRLPQDGPLRASCHVFYIDPELARHREHAGIAGRFGLDCAPDPRAPATCPEFPRAPPDVLRLVTPLYGDMGGAVERLRAKLETETGRGNVGAGGPGRSHGPEEAVASLWDRPKSPDGVPDGVPPDGPGRQPETLSEWLAGPDSLTEFYGGPPPQLRFRFKPPPPLAPWAGVDEVWEEPPKAGRSWFSKSKWARSANGDPETRGTTSNGGERKPAPPRGRVPPDGYGSVEIFPMMPPKEEWTQAFAERKNHSSSFWGLAGLRASRRRRHRTVKRLARSLDDLESAASSDGDYGGVQLQGCCSRDSLDSNGSLAAGRRRRGIPEGGAAGWAACFEGLLQDPVGVRYFSEFLKKEFSQENILFWQACEYFGRVPASDKKQLSRRAGEIYDSFLSSRATMPVNIDSQAQLADDVLTSPRPEMFRTQQLQIFNLMKFDSYSRFLKSSLYRECLRAEAEGLPLPDPYQIPCSPAPSKHSAGSDRSAVSTPKKDCGKARPGGGGGGSLNEDGRDESGEKKRGIFFSWSRNRSFGKGPKKKEVGELDYWAGHGRRESQGSLSSSASLDTAASCSAGKTEEPSPRRCKVTLPDGSRSSVALRPGASVRDLLQVVCAGVGVNVAAVDLFLVGGEKPLVLDQDCVTLSSRELRLEKRTLFRLDLVPINRSVGLKAKPGKPVAEVLRPVAAKYGLPLAELVVKIAGRTEPLDLGAPVSTLDGLRVVLERGHAPLAQEASESTHLKKSAPPGSLSATGESRRWATPEEVGGRESGADSALPGQKRNQKKINVDEAEELLELLSRAQSSRADDQRGLLSKEDLVLPDFLRPPSPEPPRPRRQNAGRPQSPGSPPASGRPPLGARPRLRPAEEEEEDGGSPLPAFPSPVPSLEGSLPEANFTPPPLPLLPPTCPGARDAEAKSRPGGAEEREPGGEHPEPGPSLRGYAAQLRQCQSRMSAARRGPSGGPDDPRRTPPGPEDLFKATVV
ncbi:regulator of G-protein signaling 12-like isoform X2 [Stigmatopora nigra]